MVQPTSNTNPTRTVIEEHIGMYLEANAITLTDAQYQSAYAGVEYWLLETMPSAVNDSVETAREDGSPK